MKDIIVKILKFFKNLFSEKNFVFGITKAFYKEYVELLKKIKDCKDYDVLDKCYEDINSLYSFYNKYVDNMFLVAKIGRLYGALNEKSFILDTERKTIKK